ncbi:hypothetical protein EB001_26235 [bacterium]|nr:hypothetical protein [bacterium]
MAHFAKLDDHNIVLDVNVVNNDTIDNLPFPESEPVGVAFLTEWSGGYTNWKQTSYNANFRKNYAGVNFVYDATLDAFIPPKPYPSWLLNTQTCLWQAPIPYPNDGKLYSWDEATQTWVVNEN